MTGARSRVLVVGEALVDIVPAAGGSTVEVPGGSCANVAIALARLGGAPTLLTALGSDPRGGRVRRWLEADGVAVRASTLDRTSTATAALDPSGAATYTFDLSWSLDGVTPPVADIVHVGSIAALVDPGADDVDRLVDEARGAALITYDPNVRPSLLPDHAAVSRRVSAMVARADVVKASDDDIRWLHPGDDPAAVARRWLAAGPALVVVTLGSAGALAVAASGTSVVAGVPTAVVDTVGAGDTFMAALIRGVALLGRTGADARGALRSMGRADLDRLLRYAAAAASVTVSRRGADPPRPADLPDSLLLADQPA